MFLFSRRSLLRGGLYHIALILICGVAFNWGFQKLTGINIIGRVLTGTQIPDQIVAGALCVSAIIVLWNNWVD